MDTPVAHLRLTAQHLVSDLFDTPEEVVRHMGAIQAQDYGQALWAIASRTKNCTIADVEKAVADGKIVRTWPMRGTIHFVLPENARWMVDLSATRMVRADGTRQKQLGLNPAILENSRQVAIKALKGGKKLSRPDILRALNEAGISTDTQRGYHILWHLTQTGTLCIGPTENKQQTFVLLKDWAPHASQLSREKSLAKLASMYFYSHGPATLVDFAWWGGLTQADARASLNAVKDNFAVKIIGKDEYYMQPGLKPAMSHNTLLLAGFDEYLLGYRSREHVVHSEGLLKIVPGKNGIFLASIARDGQLVGTWKRTIKPKKITIAIHTFVPEKTIKKELAPTLERYAHYIGLPLEYEE